MTSEPLMPHSPGRLWVLFDGSRGSQAALLQGVSLAQQSGRELRALYVEDQALINCSALSMVSEVGAVSGRTRPVSPASHAASQAVRRQRAQACIDHLLGPAAGMLRLESHRGNPLAVLAELVAAEDWVMIGRGGYASWQAGRLGSLTRQLVEQLNVTLLIASPSGAHAAGPWLLILDSARAVDARCAAARALTVSLGASLRVVADPALGIGADSGGEWIRARITGPLTLQKLIQDLQASGLIVSPDSALIRQGLMAGWLRDVDGPLVVLRD